MDMPEHQDAETLYRLLEGLLDPSLEGAVESHLWRCEACRALRDECEATLAALGSYGRRIVPAPAGYWEDFWARWPLAGDLRLRHAASRPVSRVTHREGWTKRLAPGLASAAVLLLAVGLWWAAGRDRGGADRLALSLGPPSPSAQAGARQLVVGTVWEADVEAIARLTLAVGSMDPLSKGVVLTSLAEEP